MTLALDRANPDKVADLAERVRLSADVSLPPLSAFNSAPCPEHSHLGKPERMCLRCGVILGKHQRVAAMWLFLKRRALLADPMGFGKTISAAGMMAIAAQAGEFDQRRGGGRALVVCRPTAVAQWVEQMRRMLPGLASAAGSGSRKQRSKTYGENWDILVMGHQMFLRDCEVLRRFGVTQLIIDDVDEIRHSDTQTAYELKMLAQECRRVAVLTGTPLQKKLEELYDVLMLMGFRHQLGNREAFLRRYVIREPEKFFDNKGNERTRQRVAGYRNLPEFKTILAPHALRRSIKDLDADLEMPKLIPYTEYVELYPKQRERYRQLQRRVVTILKEQGAEIKQATGFAATMYATKICEGLASLDEMDTPDSSVKFDWLLSKLQNEWSGESEDDPGEKVVVFCQYKPGVQALLNRLDRAGIGNVVIWGNDRDYKSRERSRMRFWNDPQCRVLVGTTAIEQSINLQIARRLVNIDQIMNPARMNQLAGRICRIGSSWQTVFVHNLLATDTHEERLLIKLQTEAALSSAVWSEDDPIYKAFNPVEMMELIAPGSQRRRLAAVS